jgi:hypothetical protein
MYTYTMDFYSAIRNNDTIEFEVKWMQLEGNMLNEISQAQKDNGCMFSLICGRQIQKINIFTKQAWSYTNSYVEHVCNSRNVAGVC